MDTTTAATSYPIRIARTTTGAVHAAREVTEEVIKYEGEIGSMVLVKTGRFRTRIEKACGADSNTVGTRYAATQRTMDPQAEVTCKKCRKALGL